MAHDSQTHVQRQLILRILPPDLLEEVEPAHCCLRANVCFKLCPHPTTTTTTIKLTKFARLLLFFL